MVSASVGGHSFPRQSVCIGQLGEPSSTQAIGIVLVTTMCSSSGAASTFTSNLVSLRKYAVEKLIGGVCDTDWAMKA